MKCRPALLGVFLISFGCSRDAVQTARDEFLSSTEPVVDYPAGLPIPTDHNIASDEKFCAIYKAWGNRVIIEVYERKHPGDTIVPGFLRESFGYLLLNLTEEARNRFNARGEELERADVRDPAFQLMTGLLRLDVPEKEALWRQAISGFQQSDYAPFLLFLTAANLSKSLADRGAGSSEIEATDRIALSALKVGLGHDSFMADEMPSLRWRLMAGSADSLFQRHANEAADIFKAAKVLPEWMKEFAQGRAFEMAIEILSSSWRLI